MGEIIQRINDWFIVDGQWRHLQKHIYAHKIDYFCDGELQETTSTKDDYLKGNTL